MSYFDDVTDLDDSEEFKELDLAVSNLESKYFHRGLQFETGFLGSVPVQAYGHLDGMRFYFRFRHDIARLDLGVYNAEKEEADYQRDLEHERIRKEKAAKDLAAGEITEMDYMFWTMSTAVKVEEDNKDYYPNPVLKSVSIHGYTGDSYAGTLNGSEAEDLFSQLADRL